jgi:adenylate kinase
MALKSPQSKVGEAPSRDPQVRDLEVKDASLIFNAIWNSLVDEKGEANLRFPKEIFWLNGAPGSGKGTHTQFIMEFRDITAEPVLVSSLLQSPEAKKLIDAGLLVGDREVTDIVFRRLLDSQYKRGAIVDGFPRSLVQVECLKLFYLKLMELRAKYLGTLHAQHFPKPHFHIVVLFVDEKVSVDRQLDRGRKMEEWNREVEASGVGQKQQIRKTDLDPAAARNRYRLFKERTYDSLRSLREIFYYHFINAQGTIEEVQERIIDEMRYQSSLELDQATYDRLAALPIADSIIEHARQDLVNRLDTYEQMHGELFGKVVDNIEAYFMPIIRRHAITGRAYINTEDKLFHDPLAIAMLLDIFSERGYNASVDLRKEEIPHRIDPNTYEVITKVKKVYRVSLTFKGSDIRRGS